MLSRFTYLSALILLIPSMVIADDLEEMFIIGSRSDIQTVPGSAFILDTKELEKFVYTDINRMIRQVPGVYLQEEDGLGLRPNIGIRGAGSERSEKITLMEDGVLIAPAPYAAPAAYYFPTASRMKQIEVLKGAPILKYGPSTVAGVVNLISTEISEEPSGKLNVEAGEYGTNRLNAHYSSGNETFAWLVETTQVQSDGFKDIDRSSRDTGYNISDYLIKTRFKSDQSSYPRHQLDFKYQSSDETSNQTYVGLSDADFDRDPNRLYGLTALDEMNTDHSGTNLRYLITFSEQFSLSTTAYYNQFERDWFKVDRINGGGFVDTIDLANAGDLTAQGVLDGTIDADIRIKHNNREYESKGIQFTSELYLRNHEIQTGIRIHEDSADRFQPSEDYTQTAGQLSFVGIVDPSSSNNRVEKAEALAIHVMDVWKATDAQEWTLALRYEDIDTEQRRYSDVARSSSELTASNNVNELLASIGFNYSLNEQWNLIAGYHTGFAPASPDSQENVDPEKSDNFEAGFRYQSQSTQISAIWFFSDYKNKVTNCSVAFPCGAITSGSQSEGESRIQGLEFSMNTTLHSNGKYTVPFSISYTFTDADITNSQDSGNQNGDALPYIPEHALNAQIGLELFSGLNTYLSASYIGEMCINNECNRADVDSTFLKTDDGLVFDLASHYPLSDTASVYLKVDNLSDEQVIVARSPGGARPGKPRTASVGMKLDF